MTETISPLQAIHQKELELRRRVEQAQRQAEAQMLVARQEAKKIIAQAEQQGRAEAEDIFQQGLEAARQQAQDIVAGAHQEAATLRDRATARLDKVAGQIVALVLPNGHSSQT